MRRIELFISSRTSPLNRFRRWYSITDTPNIPNVDFTQLKDELKSKKVILIDVREKDELTTDGKILESKHVPLGEINSIIELSDERFRAQYGFDKPLIDDNVIIHCKMGVRALKAALALNNFGYKQIKVYPGIKDWIENGGPLQK